MSNKTQKIRITKAKGKTPFYPYMARSPILTKFFNTFKDGQVKYEKIERCFPLAIPHRCPAIFRNCKKHTHKRRGHIHMLGVDPGHRGKGIGKQVLLAGIAYLQSKGIRLVELTVDEENKTACALYKSLGFEISAQTVWYEKLLD